MPLNYSIDLTDNKIYSLSDKSDKILKNTPKDLELNLFWSKSETSVPSEINSYGNYISDFLYQLSEVYNFEFNIIDPIIELERLKRELDKLCGELEINKGKLSNRSFIEKAPSPIVEKVRNRVREIEDAISHTENQLRNLRSD